MTFPLEEPHLAELREVCMIAKDMPPAAIASWLERLRRQNALGPGVETALAMVESIAVPTSAAQLARDLLGACGVRVLRWGSEWPADEAGCADVRAFGAGLRAWVGGGTTEGGTIRRDMTTVTIPAIVLALLDALALTEGRAEAALKALRGAGR